MKTLFYNRLTAHLVSIDLRALALFRIAFGSVCIADIIRRFPRIELFYSNNGIWSNHMALFNRENLSPVFSLLYSFSTPEEVTFFFVATLALLTAFTLGYKTRTVQFLTLLFMVSIINRNTLLVYGGDSVIVVFLFLTLFLPLGARWSLDALSSDSLDDAGIVRTGNRTQLLSIGVFLLFLQIALIYFTTSYLKDGITWITGDAVYYSLHQDRIATPLAVWARSAVSIEILRWITWFSLGIEIIVPYLVLSPFAVSFSRRCAILLLFSFHLGIAFFLNLGVFSFVMISLLPLLLPSEDLDRIERVIGRAAAHPPQNQAGKVLPVLVREAASLFLFLVMIWHWFLANPHIRDFANPTSPKWLTAFVEYTSFREGWGMFSPDAPMNDHHLVIDIELASGRHIDPQTGKPPEIKALEPGDIEWDQHWDQFTRIANHEWNNARFELKRWAFERKRGLKLDPNEKVVSMKVWLVRDRTPPPDSSNTASPIPFETELVFEEARGG